MNDKKCRIFVGFLVIIFILVSYLYLTYNPIQSFNFNGKSESFDFIGQKTELLFKAKKIHFTTNDTVFFNVNNISIESKNGELKQINRSHYVQFKTNTNIYRPISINDIDMTLLFSNSPMSLNYNLNRIDISGYMYPLEFKPNGGEVTIQNSGVNNVFVGVEEIADFKRIFFEMDNTSSIMLSLNNIELNAFGVSDLIIDGNKLSTINMSQGEGILRLDNHLFDIKNADGIDIEVLQTAKSYIRVDGVNIIFNGFTNSAKLNNEKIIMGDILYWLKIQPEKINAYSSLINLVLMLLLVGTTLWYAHSTKKLVSIETDNKKHEKQRFLNILLAELEANSLLLDDLKKSVQIIIDDNSKIHQFEHIDFREDGFNTFRNQGGFEYISPELYSELVDYYNRIIRISKKFDLSTNLKTTLFFNYIKEGNPIQDIEKIKTCTNNLEEKLKDEMNDL